MCWLAVCFIRLNVWLSAYLLRFGGDLLYPSECLVVCIFVAVCFIHLNVWWPSADSLLIVCLFAAFWWWSADWPWSDCLLTVCWFAVDHLLICCILAVVCWFVMISVSGDRLLNHHWWSSHSPRFGCDLLCPSAHLPCSGVSDGRLLYLFLNSLCSFNLDAGRLSAALFSKRARRSTELGAKPERCSANCYTTSEISLGDQWFVNV